MQKFRSLLRGIHLTPLRVAMLYCAFSALWIVASGYLLTYTVEDAVLQGRLELLKGLLFVLVTTGLLYLLLSIWHAKDDAERLIVRGIKNTYTTILLLFLGLILTVPLLGFAISKLYTPHVEREAFANLESIARLKTSQIEYWLDERRADAMVLAAGNTEFVRAVGGIASQQASHEDEAYVRGKLENLRLNYHYDTMLLLDSKAGLLLAEGSSQEVSDPLVNVVKHVQVSGTVHHTDLYKDRSDKIFIDWVVPIFSVAPDKQGVVAVVVLRSAPEAFLYPLIQLWPTSSETAETMLVKRDGDAVLYLSELKSIKDAALTMHLPISSPDLPAAIALRSGFSGMVHGKDYLGESVLSAYRPVRGADWFVVAKIHQSEVLAPLRQMVVLITSIALIFEVVLIFALLMLWRQQLRLQSLAMLAHKTQSERLLQRFFSMPFVGMAVISPDGKRFTEVNDYLCQLTGYSREELLQSSCLDHIHPYDKDGDLLAFDSILRGESSGYVMEKRYFHKDGHVIHAAVDTQCVRKTDGSVDYLLCIAHDITRQKADEARIHRLTQLYAALSQCNLAIVRCSTEQELFEHICQVIVEFGGMQMAWIGRVNFEQQIVEPVASYGDQIGYLQDIEISIEEDHPMGNGPTARAVRDDTPYWCQDFLNDANAAPWLARSHGQWGASAALPIHHGGMVIGVLCIYSGVAHAFDEDARNLLAEMAVDISYAIDNFDLEARRARAEAMVMESESKFHLLFDRSLDGLLILDGDQLIECNPAALEMMRCSLAHILHTPPWALSPPEQPDGRPSEEKFREMIAIATERGRHRFEWTYRRLNGEDFPAEVSMVTIILKGKRVFYTTWRDITEHKHAVARIRQLAHFDVLTGLPNRTLLTDRVNQATSYAQRNEEALTLMFFDLDRFKNVNDSLGHDTGDQLLIQVAHRIQSTLREEDTIARIGGDEFVLLLPSTNADAASRVAEKVLQLFTQPFQIGNHSLTITPSIGIAVYPEDGADFEKMLKSADIAMYRAKRAGRNNFQFFTAKMQEDSIRVMQLEAALQHAIGLEQFTLNYQPQLSLETGQVIGVEALLRWQHPEYGWVSPAEFIPVAEETGDILKIGAWVIEEAVRQAKVWLDAGYPPIKVAVNLSAAQFRHPHLPETVSNILKAAELPPELIELELTESVSMDDPLAAIAVMDNLAARGVRMSIDDFGTGYSSLSYLKRFKVYKLKIDQSFVRDIMTDPEDRAIVNSIISLAKSLGMKTIAEGVETTGQVEYLKECQCDEVQGYYFSKPLPANEFEAYFKAQKR